MHGRIYIEVERKPAYLLMEYKKTTSETDPQVCIPCTSLQSGASEQKRQEYYLLLEGLSQDAFDTA